MSPAARAIRACSRPTRFDMSASADQDYRVAADKRSIYALADAHDLRLGWRQISHARMQCQLERITAAVKTLASLEQIRSGTGLEAERSPRRTDGGRRQEPHSNRLR